MSRMILIGPLVMAACTAADDNGVDPTPAPVVMSLGAIETDMEGRCFATTAGPTQTNIITELIKVVPEARGADGAVTSPAVFRSITRPQTVTTGPGQRFETLCPPGYSEAFVSTLQRALLVRRTYDGPITGQYDEATSLAVQMLQRADRIDSPLLAVQTARTLGILAVPRS